MRKVMVSKSKNIVETLQWVDEEVSEAYFHRFSIDHEKYAAGRGYFPIAVIEFEDGRVETCRADKIRFLTPPNRDRKKPHGPSLPHHRTYGSRIRRFLETCVISCCPGRCQFGQSHLTKETQRQRQRKRWRLTQLPWAMRTLACVPSLVHAHSTLSEFAVTRAAPLFPGVAS